MGSQLFQPFSTNEEEKKKDLFWLEFEKTLNYLRF